MRTYLHDADSSRGKITVEWGFGGGCPMITDAWLTDTGALVDLSDTERERIEEEILMLPDPRAEGCYDD